MSLSTDNKLHAICVTLACWMYYIALEVEMQPLQQQMSMLQAYPTTINFGSNQDLRGDSQSRETLSLTHLRYL